LRVLGGRRVLRLDCHRTARGRKVYSSDRLGECQVSDRSTNGRFSRDRSGVTTFAAPDALAHSD
jgi:hypothetical protein